ncbi:MAG: hypothetical protein KDC66_23735, partial [Phaeodactylibacter sp.]|nr:hypothetical protein [Phaeodactylibacter sp.]
DYMVRAVSVRDGVAYYSDNAAVNLNPYPNPPAPMNFSASDGTYENRVELRWDMPLDANIDRFYVLRNFILIAELDSGQRTYTDVFNGIGNAPGGVIEYEIVAIRSVYGLNFYSQYIIDTGYPGLLRAPYNILNDPGATSSFGWALGSHQNKLAVGAPFSDSGSGRVSFYENSNSVWNLSRSYSGASINKREFGKSVDVFGGQVKVGAPGSDSNQGSSIWFGNFTATPFVSPGGGPSSRLAEVVAVTGSRYYLTVQPDSPTPARQLIGNITTLSPLSSTQFITVNQPANPANQKYVSLDASETYIVAGATTGTATEEGFVDVYKRSGNSVTHIKRMDGEENGNNYGVSVSIKGDILAVGADKKQSGGVYIYRVSDSSPYLESIQQITQPALPNNTNTDLFGSSLALSGDYLIVGARNHYDIGSTSNRTGLAYLYKQNGSTYEYIDVLSIPDGLGANGDNFGFSVTACDEGFAVGAPYFGGKGGVFFYSTDLVELWAQKLISVSASDGLYSNQTRVEWVFTGNRDYINGFNVYRDDELLKTVGPEESLFLDTEGIPGKEYTYMVKVVSTSDRESYPKSDKGYRRGIGVLEGDVYTAVGSAPVPGVTITAEAVIDGEKYTYSSITGVNGHFYLGSVYFSDTTVSYTVMADFEGHEFLSNPISVSISPENSVKSNIIFIDNTAYIARGVVRHEGVSCGLEGITVRAVSLFNSGAKSEETATTNEDGEYSLVLRPGQAGLVQIRIEIDSMQVRTDELGMAKDTVIHRFMAMNATAFNSFGNFPRESVIDFVDTVSYDVELVVTTVCGGPASSNGRFDIEISTRDGCFQANALTGVNGRATVALPPLDGLIITVKGAVPNSVENLLIVDYLRYRPGRIDLLALHLDNTRAHYSQAVLDSLAFKKLVYHKPATIAIANEFGESFCDDASQPRMIRQGKNYTIRFNIKETHLSTSCRVDEGIVVINNAAAENNRDTLFYVPERQAFESHSFKGGTPNLVAPYRKGINVKYFSSVGDLLAELTIPVVVLGSAPLPGSDIIVDVTDDEGQVKLPIYVLRDPPGDGSFSSIEEGTTITKSLTDLFSFRGAGGVKTDLQFSAAGVGLFLEIEAKGGGSTATENSYEMSFTTRQTISTSSTSDFVGVDADVLVGIGASTQYGLVEEVRYDETNCTLLKVQRLDISLNEIKTDWYYTVGQIKQLAKEKLAQVDAVRAGTLEIQVGGMVLDTAKAIGRLTTEAQNWESILDYHSRQSVPYYQLCAEKMDPNTLWGEVQYYRKEEEFKRGIGVFGEEVDFDAATAPIEFVSRVQKAKEARRRFCADPAVGSYNAQDSFILNQPLSEIIFTTDLAAKYEYSARAVDYYLDSLYLSEVEVLLRLNNVGGSPSALFSEIENSTFSAGVNVEKSATVTRTTSSTASQRGFFDFSLVAGPLLNFSAEAGFGVVTQIADAESKIGVQLELNFEWGQDHYSAKSVESTLSYTLSDDDPGDQFSVTAIKGRDPGHTPYFQLLGGRSSCPPENGSIVRDQFDISLWDPETQSTFDFQELRNQDIESSAKFYLQLTNLSPFGEQRDLFVYHEGESNTNGAFLYLAGQELGGGNYDGVTYTFINPNQPVILPLELLPSPGIYQYDSIQIVLRPSCSDGDLYLLGVRDTVYISAYFDHPCSDVTIAAPGDDWLIRRRNPFNQDSRESLNIEIRDYDSGNPELKEIYLEYRRIGDGSGWTRIP